MDRQLTNRALAKAIAYVECGKPESAVQWVAALLSDFDAAGVDVVSAFRLSGSMTPIPDEPKDMSAASTYLGRLLG